MKTEKRIVATFQPQAWINDCAVEIDGAREFDVTDLVVAMGKEKALELEDCSEDADDLWYDWYWSNPKDRGERHNGPFTVTVAAAIETYFQE